MQMRSFRQPEEGTQSNVILQKAGLSKKILQLALYTLFISISSFLHQLNNLPRKQKWNRSRDGVMAHPCTDSKHGCASVLKFDQPTTVVDSHTEWVPSQVTSQATRLEARCDSLIVRQLSVRVGKFVDFHKCDGCEHLSPRLGREALHGIERRHGGKIGEFDVLCDRQVLVWADVVQGESQLVERETDRRQHGGPSVLEFGGPEESSSFGRPPLGRQEFPFVFTNSIAEGCDVTNDLGRGLGFGGSDRCRSSRCRLLNSSGWFLVTHSESDMVDRSLVAVRCECRGAGSKGKQRQSDLHLR